MVASFSIFGYLFIVESFFVVFYIIFMELIVNIFVCVDHEETFLFLSKILICHSIYVN